MEGGSGVRLRAALLAYVVVLASMQEDEGAEFQPRYPRSLVSSDGSLVVEKHAEYAVLPLIHAIVDRGIALVSTQPRGGITVSILQLSGNADSGWALAGSNDAFGVVFVSGNISSA